MDKLKSFSGNQAVDHARRPAAQAETRNRVHNDSSFRRAICERRTPRCQQLNLMPAFPQPAQRQQRLALPATPFPLQVYIKHSHGFLALPEQSFFSISVNLLSQAARWTIGLRSVFKIGASISQSQSEESQQG
jgi:hypothetical protein